MSVNQLQFVTITLELTPHIEIRDGLRFHLDRFDAWLDGELLVTSRQPLYAGARKLKERGVDPSTLLTIRHRGKDYDSTIPLPIDLLAELTVAQRDRGGLHLERWQPFIRGRLQKAHGGERGGSCSSSDESAFLPATAYEADD